MLLWSSAATTKGRPARAANSSIQGTGVLPALVIMSTPRPTSRRLPHSACISASSASRDGMGMPFSPLCWWDVVVEKPQAPALSASTTMPRIASISSGLAARLGASCPSTKVRTEECPTKQATFGPTPRRSSRSRYSGKL